MPMSRSRSTMKVLAIVLVALVAALGVVGLWIVSLTGRKWAAMENRVQELRAGLEAAPLERVPLGREQIPGNSWDDYLLPMSDNDIRSAEIGLNHLLYGSDDGSEIKPVIEKHRAALDPIRRAARRQTCKAPPARLVDGFTLVSQESSTAVRMGVALSLAQAHLLSEQENIREALEICVDVYLCGRDLAGTRTGMSGEDGIKYMEQALDELSSVLKRPKPDPSLLLELERRADLLDPCTR